MLAAFTKRRLVNIVPSQILPMSLHHLDMPVSTYHRFICAPRFELAESHVLGTIVARVCRVFATKAPSPGGSDNPSELQVS